LHRLPSQTVSKGRLCKDLGACYVTSLKHAYARLLYTYTPARQTGGAILEKLQAALSGTMRIYRAKDALLTVLYQVARTCAALSTLIWRGGFQSSSLYIVQRAARQETCSEHVELSAMPWPSAKRLRFKND